MSLTRERLAAIKNVAARVRGESHGGVDRVAYEKGWDDYARVWRVRHPRLAHIGDEWTGQEAGAASTVEEYSQLIENRYVAPYIGPSDSVMEIGVGGGKTAALLKKYCDTLVCADISSEMLRITRERIGDEGVRYVKLDGITLSDVRRGSLDVCFCFDTMVHMEPRDIFNYLTQVPKLMRGRRLCVFHHTNTISDLGWKRFLSEWNRNLMGRSAGSFSVMTNELMARFLDHLGYEVITQDTEAIPRDCVWVARAPRVL
ncbi:MAG: class I SAM-dependent methyltransferase [Chloroflexi bacterium]|nr:MAG: class I SAM-dependent methyltransferase [Chloroflexota bacterium]